MELFEATQRQLSEAQDENIALRAENERLRKRDPAIRSFGEGVDSIIDRLEREIENFAADNKRLQAENERLTAKCNRMCRSAKIEDIHPGMAPQQEEGMSGARLGELKKLACHSKSLDDLGNAVIELIEEVRRLKKC